jgi:enoyl-CoA hydratase
VNLGESDFPSVSIERSNQTVTVRLKSAEDLPPGGNPGDVHWELGELFARLRGDTTSRVIVLTGYSDRAFFLPPPTPSYTVGGKPIGNNDPAALYRIFTGIARTLEGIVAIEKPVVAKVNGDAMGFGQSLVFACDLIVAREDATIVDHHMGNGEHGRGSPMGVVPGDGGAAFLPSHLPPALAKEYLMLGKPLKAAELARLGVINYAVPADKLDTVADDLVRRLLERSAYALAWTKRVANRAFAAGMSERLDAGMAYEMVNFYQAERTGWKSIAKLD